MSVIPNAELQNALKPDATMKNQRSINKQVLKKYFAIGILVLCTLLIQAEQKHLTPAGSGDQSGIDWNNALPESQIQNAVDNLVAGDSLLIGSGIYTSNFRVNKSGSQNAPITISGEDTGDGYPLFQGTWSSSDPENGSEWIALDFGASYINLSHLKADSWKIGVITFKTSINYHLHINNVDVTKSFQAFYLQTVENSLIEHCDLIYYIRRGVRFQQGCKFITLRDCVADQNNGDTSWPTDWPFGFMIEDGLGPEDQSDLTFIRCEARNNYQPLGTDYWNGDGFVVEDDHPNIRFYNCIAYHNQDGGWDDKGKNTYLENCLSVNNGRNYRVWNKATLKNCISSYSEVRGTSSSSSLGLWAGGEVTLENCTFHNNQRAVSIEGGSVHASNSIFSVDGDYKNKPIDFQNSSGSGNVFYQEGSSSSAAPNYLADDANYNGRPMTALESAEYGPEKGYIYKNHNFIPEISISFPIPNSIFNQGDDITITVSINDKLENDITATTLIVNGEDKITSTQSPYSLYWKDLIPGTYILQVKVQDDKGATAISSPVKVIVKGSLPDPWLETYIGENDNANTIITNSAIQINNKLGGSIDNEGDQLHYVFVKPTANPEVIVRLGETNNAEAGIMLRKGLDTANPMYYFGKTASNDLKIVIRNEASEFSEMFIDTISTAINYLRIIGYDNKFFLFYSEDSLQWTQLKPLNAPNIDNYFVGLTNIVDKNAAEGTVNFTSVYIGENLGSTPPTVNLISPQNQKSFTEGNITLQAEASDEGGSISFVAFYINGQKDKTIDTAPFQYSKNLSEGIYEIFATTYDNDGMYGISATHAIAVGRFNDSININFQHAGFNTPDNYLADKGESFADRFNGFTYGWSENRDGKLSIKAPTPMLNSSIKMGSSQWEMMLENGNYFVSVVAGDAVESSQINNIDIEGIIINDKDPKDNFDEFKTPVVVTDGKLTIKTGTDAVNMALCYITIYKTDNITPLYVSAPIGIIHSQASEGLQLQWSKNSEIDLDGYNLFRRSATSEDFVQINSEIIRDTTFLDKNVKLASTYFYKVEAIDKHGQKSLFSEVSEAFFSGVLVVDMPEISLQISPNPFTFQTKILCDQIISNFSIYDSTGKEVFHSNVNDKTFVIYASQLAKSGLYFLKISTNGKSCTMKLLKE